MRETKQARREARGTAPLVTPTTVLKTSVHQLQCWITLLNLFSIPMMSSVLLILTNFRKPKFKELSYQLSNE